MALGWSPAGVNDAVRSNWATSPVYRRVDRRPGRTDVREDVLQCCVVAAAIPRPGGSVDDGDVIGSATQRGQVAADDSPPAATGPGHQGPRVRGGGMRPAAILVRWPPPRAPGARWCDCS